MFNLTVKNILILAFNKSIAEEINLRLRMPQKFSPATCYVEAIVQAALARENHLVVKALAGSGKTTVLMRIVSEYEYASKRASTAHSFGFNSLRFHLKKLGVENPDVSDLKISMILDELTNYNALNVDDQKRVDTKIGPAKRLVSLMKSQGFLAIRGEATNEELYELCDKHDVELPDPAEHGITPEDVFELAS